MFTHAYIILNCLQSFFSNTANIFVKGECSFNVICMSFVGEWQMLIGITLVFNES